ncbi:ANTAR domain-containing protein [Amycolatopsis tolypomycina]|uniref:ANTAR domain-containing protein n=1 Tax=Amycolatopsis tolypomycina TaxID=208445 RepID=A0A1H4WUS1_9PSEU|nr:ANTAR domain-containing protein [Amycolatopsis tolypomycina]SEC97063.1 ANTAR domain-containing protein [Amycolatopsis tolypomycina]
MTETLMNAADRWRPLAELLQALLERISGELPGWLGAGLTVSRGDRPLRVLATAGVAEQLIPAQLAHGGPVPVADATGEPVTTDRLFGDERWPDLTRETVFDGGPAAAAIRGAAALPGFWDEDGAFVLSVTLDRSPGEATLAVLQRYAKLTEMTLVVAETATAGDPDQMLDLLASRAAIEQAKGAIMAVRRCPPEEAWQTLRRASQEFNVKVRELAVALVEHVGGHLAVPPEGTREILPGAPARHAAERLWAAFTTVSP